VAAVGGAIILGVTAPVRAAVVTYTLDNAELANGDAVTGSIDFDNVAGKIDGGSVNVNDGGVDVMLDVFQYGTANAIILYTHSSLEYVTILTGTGGSDTPLTGTPGDAEPIDTTTSFFEANSGPVAFVNGSITDGPSVPEPSSIMATVTAVTLGVGLRRMKRKV